MLKKRKLLSLLFVSFWVLLFSLGLSQVFLYLQGYTPFSFIDKNEVQKGYATFSSRFPLFLDGQYMGKGSIYGRYDLGKYSVCADSLGYDQRCFKDVEVMGNDYRSVKRENIYLLKKNRKNSLFWTSERSYSLENSLFWYDELKKQIFFIESTGEGVQSYFPQYPLEKIEYREDLDRYVIWGRNADGERVEMFIPFSGSSFSFLSSVAENMYSFGDFAIEKKGDLDLEDRVVVHFDEKLERLISFRDSDLSILIFPSSLYLFSPQEEELTFIARRDPDSFTLFLQESGDLFFIQNEELRSVALF